MMRSPLSILLLFLTTASSIGSAQFENFYENWRWAHFTTKTGLPSNSIDDILEAEDGTMWVSSAKGIAWYDGFRWNDILIDKKYIDQRATKIIDGLNGNIIILLNENIYFGNKNGFVRVVSDSVSIEKVNSACMLDTNKILISTRKEATPFIIYNTNGGIEVINDIPAGTLHKTKSNKIWLGNRDGFFEYKNSSFRRIINHGFVRNIVENKNGYGVLSIDSPKDQIGIWEWNSNRTPVISASEKMLPVRSIDVSSSNTVIAVYETGDVRIRENGLWTKLKPIPSQMLGLICFRFNSKDDLWVGTENGLFYFRNSEKKWEWWKYGFSDPRNIVMEILKSSNGDIWIGNGNGLEIRSSTGKISTITSINNEQLGLVTGIAEDKWGNIWISSGSSFVGAFKWDGKSWKHYGYSEGLKSPRVHKIRNDKNGNLWFLGLAKSGDSHDSLRNDPGAFLFNGNSFQQISSNEGLLHNRVYSFVESRDGSVWFGTKIGLSRKSKNGWKHWKSKEFKNPVSLFALDIDKEDRVWFSTFTSTLGFIDVKDSIHWVWDWVADADYKQKVWDIKVDSIGTVWVSTTKGLYSYYNKVWSSYDIESEFGLKELRVVMPLKDKVYVGGHGIGVGILNREIINIPIKVVINEPVIEKEKVFINWTVDAYWREMPSDDIEIRYRLDDQKWSEWNKKREETFNTIEYGHHKIDLQIKDIYGNIREQEHTVEFIVPPPYYKDPVYYLPFCFLLIVIVYLILRNIRSIIVHKKNIRNQRTRIANDLHDEVGSNLASIALISQRIGRKEILPDEAREDLLTITQTSLQTSEFLKDIVWYTNPRYDTFLNLEARLREIANKMLKDLSVRIEIAVNAQENKEFSENRRNIILMYKEILHNIVKHSRASIVSIRCEHTADSFLLSVKDNGVGFSNDISYNGNGLLSLKRRSKESGAELKIISQKGEGTEIVIIFKTNLKTL